MTDKEKLDAIRAEIHRLVDVRGYDREMANDLFTFMDSLPNEPVSEVWHDASELPDETSLLLLLLKDGNFIVADEKTAYIKELVNKWCYVSDI